MYVFVGSSVAYGRFIRKELLLEAEIGVLRNSSYNTSEIYP